MKTVFITGASSGIGKACVNLFHEKGYSVVLFARDAKKLEQAAAGYKNTLIVTGDVTQEEDIKRAVAETLKKFKTIDVLVNNAGIGHFNSIEKLSKKEFNEQFQVNVTGTFLCTKHILPIMRK